MKKTPLIALLFTGCIVLSCSKKTDTLLVANPTNTPEEQSVVDNTSQSNSATSVSTEDLVKLVVLAMGGIGIDGYEKLTSSTSFVDDLGYGSLEYMELIMEIERFFQIEIPDEDSETLTTIGAMVRYLDQKSMYSPTIEDIFPRGGSGSGGGGDDEEDEGCNLNVQTDDKKIMVELCGTAANKRTKCYYWKIFSVSSGMIPMYFVSNEQAVQSNRGGNTWQFDSFEHKEVAKEGVQVIYSASIVNLVATPSLKQSGFITYNDMAQMHLSFGVDVSAICRGMPVVYNKVTSTQQVWHVSE